MFIRTVVTSIGRSRQAARSAVCVDGSSYECYCERSTWNEDFGAAEQEYQGEKCSDFPRVVGFGQLPVNEERKRWLIK
jgi:hypothetical protein